MLMKPMIPEQATLQLELLGHDFHVFRLPDTGHFAVVYRRKDGDYGLMKRRKNTWPVSYSGVYFISQSSVVEKYRLSPSFSTNIRNCDIPGIS